MVEIDKQIYILKFLISAMPEFIKLKEADRIRLFNAVKDKSKLMWKDLAINLSIGKSMLSKYFTGKCDIPLGIYAKLEKIGGIQIEKKETVMKYSYKEKELKKPTMGSKLAEVLGVLNGDGHLAPLKYEACVVGSILEQDYYRHLKELFEEVFNLEFKVFAVSETVVKLRCYSKNLVEFLHADYKLPKGNKIGKLRIPKQVYIKKVWLKNYIRGLFDTDGCIFIRRGKDIAINIASADARFLSEIKRAMESLNLKASIFQEHMYIYKKDHVKRFFEIIQPANSKHLKRYEIFKKQASIA